MALPLHQLIKIMVDEGGDSLFLLHGSPPAIRIQGYIKRIGHPPLVKAEIEHHLNSNSLEIDKTTFRDTGYVTFTFEIPGIGEFFAKWYRSSTGIGAIIRQLPYEITSFTHLGLPTSTYFPLDYSQGIRLISGSARSGRSTTLASVIDIINIEEGLKICIIHTGNHPFHHHKKGLVEDIVIRPGMKDLKQTVELAIFSMEADCIAIDGIYGRDELDALFFAARCGLHCYATVFGQSVETVIQNILYEWPHEDRKYILTLLSKHLNWILCQGLLPKASGRGQALAFEFMNCTKEIKTLIEIDRLNELGKAFSGDYSDGKNIPMEKSLANLFFKREISLNAALNFAGSEVDREYLEQLICRGPSSLGRAFSSRFRKTAGNFR